MQRTYKGSHALPALLQAWWVRTGHVRLNRPCIKPRLNQGDIRSLRVDHGRSAAGCVVVKVLQDGLI